MRQNVRARFDHVETRARSKLCFGPWLIAWITCGCGGSAFTPSFPEKQDPEITRSLRALAAAREGTQDGVVVGVGPGKPARRAADAQRAERLKRHALAQNEGTAM